MEEKKCIGVLSPSIPVRYLLILRYTKSNLITMTILTYNMSIALITFGVVLDTW